MARVLAPLIAVLLSTFFTTTLAFAQGDPAQRGEYATAPPVDEVIDGLAVRLHCPSIQDPWKAIAIVAEPGMASAEADVLAAHVASHGFVVVIITEQPPQRSRSLTWGVGEADRMRNYVSDVELARQAFITRHHAKRAEGTYLPVPKEPCIAYKAAVEGFITFGSGAFVVGVGGGGGGGAHADADVTPIVMIDPPDRPDWAPATRSGGHVLVLRASSHQCSGTDIDKLESWLAKTHTPSTIATVPDSTRCDALGKPSPICEGRCGRSKTAKEADAARLLFHTYATNWLLQGTNTIGGRRVDELDDRHEVGHPERPAVTQFNAGLVIGAASRDDDRKSNWGVTFGFRPEVYWGRRTERSVGFGGYAEVLLLGGHGNVETSLGGGALTLLPLGESGYAFVPSAGMNATNLGELGWSPAIAGGLSFGSRHFNNITSFDGVNALRVDGRVGIGASREHVISVSYQFDLMWLAVIATLGSIH